MGTVLGNRPSGSTGGGTMETSQGSGVPRLRPLGYGELLDEAFDLYRRNFVLLLVVTNVVMIPGHLLNRFLMGDPEVTADPIKSIVRSLVVLGIVFAYLPISQLNHGAIVSSRIAKIS